MLTNVRLQSGTVAIDIYFHFELLKYVFLFQLATAKLVVDNLQYYRQYAANCSARFSFLNFFFSVRKVTFGHPVESDEGYDEQDDLEDQDGDGDVGSVVHRYK